MALTTILEFDRSINAFDHKMENAISLYLRHATPCLDSGSERVNAILRIITNTCDISKR